MSQTNVFNRAIACRREWE